MICAIMSVVVLSISVAIITINHTGQMNNV